MGLTNNSTGLRAVDAGLIVDRRAPEDKVIALAGNPNVGKSTVFNSLTGMNQHTGNWPGKTVTNAQGYCRYGGEGYVLVDIPGTYSLSAHSAEEEVARDFICFGGADAVAVVCDATCLEHGLNLVLQTLEITDRVVVCVNLMDEAKRKGIHIDLDGLSRALGVPVAGTVARDKRSLGHLMRSVAEACGDVRFSPAGIRYPEAVEDALKAVLPAVERKTDRINARWLSLRLLDLDGSLERPLEEYLGFKPLSDGDISSALREAERILSESGTDKSALRDIIVSSIVKAAEDIASAHVSCDRRGYADRDRKIDRLLTGRLTGFPVMIGLLALTLWITITGANYPSQLLSGGLFWIGDRLSELLIFIGAPDWLRGMLADGVYRVLAWVVSVMLPPMAIFFPLFTLLEDLGYLPRVAFNLDKYFKKCSACGKQALTMCMGLGCNAAGVTGCRIIDSPRERLIAVLTNNFMPCNGRFPTLIAIMTMFFIGTAAGWTQSALSALMLTGIIVLGVAATFLVSKLLSQTVLKGIPTSFTLELPPYRTPQLGKVIVRSIFDRTLFVLGRAVAVAAPAGLFIWLTANVTVGDATLLSHFSGFLDPFARLIGLDGVILLAFILGFPANEIVIPIIIMAYMSSGSMMELDSLSGLRSLFVENGWTWVTAICTMLFSLMHWPCSTACLTIRKETGSWKWTALSIALPTAAGIIVCFAVASVGGCWGCRRGGVRRGLRPRAPAKGTWSLWNPALKSCTK